MILQKEPGSNPEWLIIVNPNAGKQRGSRDWDKISALLDQYGFSYTRHFTTAPLHAMELSRKMIEEGYRHMIVVGGDGTMNEVINGIFEQTAVPTTDITMGMITVGTGNDWGRMFGIPTNYEKAVRVIKEGRTFIQDAGRVTFEGREGRESRYFVNIAGLGFDALVVKKSNRLKEKGRGGQLLYFVNIFSNLMNYKHVNAIFNVDGTDYENKIFSMNVGICKYSGGGMMQVPGAIADDGLFDMTVIKKISRPDIIMSLRKLYNGTIADHRKVDTYTGKEISVDSDQKIMLETDGESLGHTPMDFRIIPKSIKIIYNTESKQNL